MAKEKKSLISARNEAIRKNTRDPDICYILDKKGKRAVAVSSDVVLRMLLQKGYCIVEKYKNGLKI